MQGAVDYSKHARATRELASRVRRLARKAADPAEKARILDHADALLEIAGALEARAKTEPVPSIH